MTQRLRVRRSEAQRSGALDAVRVLGIIAVVAGHVFDNTFTALGLYTWHVPVFFFLAGYLWKDGRTFKENLDNRVRTLLVPYAVWLALIAIPFLGAMVLLRKFDFSNLVPILLGGSYLGRPFSAFWFITALFVAGLLFYALRKLPVIAQWVLVGLGVLLAAVAGQSLAAIPLSIGVAIPSIVFIAAGALAKSIRGRISQPALIGALLLAASAVLIVTGLSAPLDMKGGNFGTPALSMVVAIAISFGLVLVAEAVSPKLGAFFNSSMTTLALCGLMVIFGHSFFIWVLSLVSLGEWPVFLISLVVPWAVALVVYRTKLAWLLLGAKKRA